MLSRLTNVVLRCLTLGSKFFLFFFLAKYLSPSELGVYGLIVASISYSLLVIGFDFYTFSNRDLIKTEKIYWAAKLRDQTIVYAIIYIALIPLFVLLFLFNVLPRSYFFFFTILLILEHIAQELNRLYIVMSEQLLASIILFVRNGFWCFIVVPFMAFLPAYRTIETVMLAWLLGVLSACLLATTRLKDLDKVSLANQINWKWIKSGVIVAIPMLCSTLAVRGLFTFDRYLVHWLSGSDILGAYVLFMSIGNSLLSFLDAGVIVFMYPKLVELAHSNNGALFNKNMLTLFYQSVGVLFLMSALTLICLEPLLTWVGKSFYLDHSNMFILIIIAMSIFSLSLVPQIGLYAHNKDMPIILSHIAGLATFFALFLATKNLLHSLTVPYALIGACLIVLIIKTYAFFKLQKSICTKAGKEVVCQR